MIDTSGSSYTLTSGATTYTGVLSGNVAVFDFDSINLSHGTGIVFTAGSVPVALLSRSDATIAGSIDGSGQAPPNYIVNVGSPGGPGGGYGGLVNDGGSGGGGHGAPANLAQSLQGGGGGAGSLTNGGGGGGGGLEIGAVGSLIISGSILANGGTPVSSDATGYGAGGGGGGGILLDAASVQLTGTLSAAGGDGGAGGTFPGPGNSYQSPGSGGDGGAVTILGAFSSGNGATIDVAGGAAGGPGSISGLAGTLEINGSIVPEPASLVLLCTGLLGSVGGAWLRRRRTAA